MTPISPIVTIPGALTPVEPFAGTLELNPPVSIVPTSELFLVAPPVTQPIFTFINPTPVESFVVYNLSSVTLPTFTPLNLSPTILPTTPWSPSGVLEYNSSGNLSFVMPDLSYILPGYSLSGDTLPSVPEPTAILLALLAAPFLAHRRRF